MIPASEYAKIIDADTIRGIVNMLAFDLIVIVLHLWGKYYLSWNKNEDIKDE